MKTLTALRIFTALFTFTQLAMNSPTHAGPTINNPGQLTSILNSVDSINEFEGHLTEVNNGIRELLTQVAEMRHLNKDPNLIIAQITKKYAELRKLVSIPESKFRAIFTNHIVSMIKLAVEQSLHITQASLRTSARAHPDLNSQSATENYSSTATLAQQLTNNDIATLTILGIIGASLHANNNYNSQFDRRSVNYDNFTIIPTLGTTITSMAVTMAYHPDLPIFMASVLVPLLGTSFLGTAYWKHFKKRNLQNKLTVTMNKEFSTYIEDFVSTLQTALGTSAAPLIEAIRSGDTDAIQSAACQFALTPKSPVRVRVEAVASEAATQEAREADEYADYEESAQAASEAAALETREAEL